MKKAFIIFLSIMLVCTFVSVQADNMCVAAVETSFPHSGTIITECDVQGSVDSKNEIALNTVPEVRIDSVMVEQGEKIEKGQLLYQLNMESIEEELGAFTHEAQALENQISEIEQQNEASSEAATLALQRAEEDLADTTENMDAKVNEALSEVELAQAAYDNRSSCDDLEQQNLLSTLNEKQALYQSALEEYSTAVKEAARAVEDAELSLEMNLATETDSLEQQLLEKQEKIASLQELVDVNGEILAEEDGVVTEVLVKAGDLTSETADIRMNRMTGEMLLDVSVNDEIVPYLSEGMEARAECSTESIDGVVIREIYQEDSKEWKVRLAIPEGSAQIGDEISVHLSGESEMFNSCIPREALHINSQGKYFVYILAEKESMIGKELYAKEVAIEVLDWNLSSVAVDGIGSKDEVVVSTTKMIEDGSRIRRKDS